MGRRTAHHSLKVIRVGTHYDSALYFDERVFDGIRVDNYLFQVISWGWY
jgi:hypothetical protein